MRVLITGLVLFFGIQAYGSEKFLYSEKDHEGVVTDFYRDHEKICLYRDRLKKLAGDYKIPEPTNKIPEFTKSTQLSQQDVQNVLGWRASIDGPAVLVGENVLDSITVVFSNPKERFAAGLGLFQIYKNIKINIGDRTINPEIRIRENNSFEKNLREIFGFFDQHLNPNYRNTMTVTIVSFFISEPLFRVMDFLKSHGFQVHFVSVNNLVLESIESKYRVYLPDGIERKEGGSYLSPNGQKIQPMKISINAVTGQIASE